MTLTNTQIEFLETELKERGLTVPSLTEDFLDHFCCAIEEEMALGTNFKQAYHKAYVEICPEGVREFNLATKIIYLHKKFSVMKKLTFSIGFITSLAFLTGAFFKANHWPTANMLILFGGALFGLVFLPMYFYLKFQSDREMGINKPGATYILKNILTSFLVIATPYSILHWPGTQIVVYTGFVLFTVIFLPMVFLNWYKKMNGQLIKEEE